MVQGFTEKVAAVLSKELVTDAVLVVVLTGMDVIDLFQGRISEEQLLKNLTITLVSTAAGAAGGWAGGALGTVVLPGAGAVVGTIVGSVLVGGTAALVSQLVADKIYQSDAEEMFEIVSNEFQILGEEYFINEEEGEAISQTLSKLLTGNTLKDMYASEDRTAFARELMEPLFEEQLLAREDVSHSHVSIPQSSEHLYCSPKS